LQLRILSRKRLSVLAGRSDLSIKDGEGGLQILFSKSSSMRIDEQRTSKQDGCDDDNGTPLNQTLSVRGGVNERAGNRFSEGVVLKLFLQFMTGQTGTTAFPEELVPFESVGRQHIIRCAALGQAG
jgi:hypothetical protein